MKMISCLSDLFSDRDLNDTSLRCSSLTFISPTSSSVLASGSRYCSISGRPFECALWFLLATPVLSADATTPLLWLAIFDKYEMLERWMKKQKWIRRQTESADVMYFLRSGVQDSREMTIQYAKSTLYYMESNRLSRCIAIQYIIISLTLCSNVRYGEQ